MRYEYNGNLLEDKRVDLVSKEIVSKYPEISLDEAREIAMLEGRISTNPNLEIVFTRLYNIMLIMSYNKEFVKKVYNDLINVLKVNSNDEKFVDYYNVSLEIANYLDNKREFPFLEEV